MLKNKSILAIVPARGGSKRLKNKNLKKIKSRSLLYYTLDAAKKSKYIDKIFVSTESKKIFNEAKKYQLRPSFLRPKILSGDKVQTESVVFHVLKKIKKYDIVILLQPTSPLRTSKDIDYAINKFVNYRLKTLVSVKRINKNIKIKKFILIKKFKVKNFASKFVYNGAIYISEVLHFSKVKNFISKKMGIYCMAENKSLDIDTVNDFYKAKNLLKK